MKNILKRNLNNITKINKYYFSKHDKKVLDATQTVMIKDLYFLLKRVIILLNSFDSAGDKIRSIIKGNKRSERVHNVLLYLLNFEIWGLYEGDERSTLLSRRQSALDELNSICSSILYQIKDFQSHNSNYGKKNNRDNT